MATRKKSRKRSTVKVSRKKVSRKKVARAKKTPKASGQKLRPVIIKYGDSFKRPKHSRTFKKATMVNPKRRRKVRRNPKISLKGVFNRNTVMTIGTLGIGVMSWSYIKGYALKTLEKNSATSKISGYVGIIPAILGLLMVSMTRKPLLKNIGLGIGAIGVYDLLATNVSALKLVAPSAQMSGSYPVHIGANYSAPTASLGTPAYGRPTASKHYMQVSGANDSPYADLQF